MKTGILISIALITAISYMSFGHMNEEKTSCTPRPIDNEELIANNFDPAQPFTINPKAKLHYRVSSRFINTIKGEELYNANTIVDILPAHATTHMKEYKSVEISLVNNQSSLGPSESGKDQNLNSSQKKLLETFDYSTDFLIAAYGKSQVPSSGELRDFDLTYYMTIVPEKEAEYSEGYDNLIKYLRDGSKNETKGINRSNLKPGKVNFTVSKNGSIDNIELISTCGYTDVDTKLVDMIQNMPGTWVPAMNGDGEKVNQKLVFSFGIEGC